MKKLDKHRVRDKKILIIPKNPKRPTHIKTKAEIKQVSLDVIKTTYIVEGLSARQVANRFGIPLETVQAIIKEEKFAELRRAHVRHGMQLLQNLQVDQASTILELESKFKSIRLKQLKTRLDDYMAYYSLHGDFYRRDPETSKILKDQNGIPMQVGLPDAAKEMREVKEALVLSEGIKRVLAQVESVLKGDDTDGMLTADEFFELE